MRNEQQRRTLAGLDVMQLPRPAVHETMTHQDLPLTEAIPRHDMCDAYLGIATMGRGPVPQGHPGK